MANEVLLASVPGIMPAGGGTVVATLGAHPSGTPFSKLLHESLTDGAQLLLLGILRSGLITGESGAAAMQPFPAIFL